MDRSIDSIGSCSLDADSTDFSDTSESLNFISPSATREDFTAGIAERVRKIQTTQPLTPKLILNQPQINQRSSTATAYFDINSGKISTIVSRAESNGCYFNGNTEKFLSTKTIDLQSPTVVAHANKKPSYLNLACCVNGYSNYTNYDSVERKEINKSREVSPIRPIITMARQQRSSDNLLSIPTFVKQSPMTSISKRFASLDISDKDTTDNAGMTNGSVSNRKSFIQQRVEKLYGTTKILTSTSSTTTMTTKTLETKHTNGNHNHHHHHHNHNHVNGVNGSSPAAREIESDEKENDDDLYMNSLPVMKHLRPEFCRQLQFMNSPKKTRASVITAENAATTNSNIQSEKISAPQIISSKTKENSIEKEILQSDTKDIVMERVINHSETMPSTEIVAEKSENNNIDLSNNNNNNNNNVCSKIIEIETTTPTSNESQKLVKDGYYFLRLLFAEKERILKMADATEKELEALQSDPSTVPTEEIVGLILAAIGKSRLLATKKFKQFEGLCEENLKPKADGPQTLCGDLQGFWDMMMLQVDNVDAAFKEIQDIRESGWKKPQPPSPQPPKGSRLVKRPLTQAQNGKTKTAAAAQATAGVKKPSTAPANSEAAQKREEQRKKLLEMKRKQKAAMQQQNGSSENDYVNGDKKENGVDMIL